MSKKDKPIYVFQRWIDGRKVIIEATSLEQAEILFKKLTKKHE